LLSKNINIKIYITITFPVVCGCETWSLTLREEGRMRVFENRVPRKIFGPRRDESSINALFIPPKCRGGGGGLISIHPDFSLG
jgi:hypothetical protein